MKLNNRVRIERAGSWYRTHEADIVQRIHKANRGSAQGVYCKVTEAIISLWSEERKPRPGRRPKYWTYNTWKR